MIFPWYYCPFRQQAQRTARRPIKNHDLSGHNFEKLLVEIRGVWTIKGLGSGQRGFRRWGFNSGTTLGGKLPTAMDTNLRWQAEIRQPHQFEVKVVYLIYHYLQGLINNTRWVGNGISEPSTILNGQKTWSKSNLFVQFWSVSFGKLGGWCRVFHV